MCFKTKRVISSSTVDQSGRNKFSARVCETYIVTAAAVGFAKVTNTVFVLYVM